MDLNVNPLNRSPLNRPFTEIPNVLYIPKPYVPVIEAYPADIYDEDFNWVAQVDDYLSLKWTSRWRLAGEFELQMGRYDVNGEDREWVQDYLDKLAADPTIYYWVSIYRAGVARLGRIDSMALPLEEGGKASEIWTIKGPDAKGIFADRICMVGVDAGTGYDTVATVSAEAALRHYIDGNIVSATDANRQIPELEFETIHAPEIGGDVSYSARLETLPEVLEAICLASPDQVGYDVVFIRATKMLQFRTLIGTDRSASVMFSTRIGNLQSIAYAHDRGPVRNIAYVGDSGDLAARVITEVYQGGTEPAGLSRKETFVDGSDTTAPAEVTQKGVETLNECGAAETAEFAVMRDDSFHYASRDAAGDYALGDIVTVVYGGIVEIAARIVETTEDYGSQGAFDALSIVTGTTRDDLIRVLRQQEKKNSVRRRA